MSSTFNVSLVNLPKDIALELTNLIQTERLGSFLHYEISTLSQFFKTYDAGEQSPTDFIIAYDNQLNEDDLQQLQITQALPVILITSSFDFEMERTASVNNVNLLISEDNPELCSLVFGFIKQFKIYQQHHALVVDDSRVDSTVISNILTHEFIHTVIEHDPNNVIEILEENELINILVLDYQMPDINGCHLMQKIQTHFSDRAFIFIGLTGHRNGAIQFLQEGANNVFLKPVDGELFALSLRKHIFNFHKTQQQRNTLMNYKNIINKISHDIRNPIYVLMNINDLFIDDQIQHTSLELVEKLSGTAKENLNHIFDDLLGYIEMTNYKESPRLKACSLNSMIASQLFLETHQAKLKNIIMNQYCEKDATAFCIPNQIELVITNLTNNAVKYSIKNSEIDIRLYKQNTDIIFEVEDSSPHIPPENHQSIFESYKIQNAEKRDIDSKSLGLTFCKEIIEAHGGIIGVRSGDRGNIFYFKIPSDPEVILSQLH